MKKLIILLLSSICLFANIGTVVDVVGSSTLVRDGKNINVMPKLELKEHDFVKTGKNAKVKIFFKDNTAVSLGQNTTFKIDSYLFTGKKDSKIKFKVLKGFFKTVTGKISKIAPNRFKLQTKNATIGIRGTVFAAKVGDDADVVMCTDGRIMLFTPNGDIEVSSGNSGFAKQSQKPEIKKYSLQEKAELIKNAGWHGSMSLDELVEFIKKNFQEPLRSQLLSTVLNILEKDSDERESNGKTVVELADDIGFIDDITINGREFESLEQREIEFYPEDLKDGKVIVEGLLESQDKVVDVKDLHVELTTDGGDTWSRADGNEEWQWSFTPELEKTYEFSIRVIKETLKPGNSYASTDEVDEASNNPLSIPEFVYIGGFRLDLGDGVTLDKQGLRGSGRLNIPSFSGFGLLNYLDVNFEGLNFERDTVTLGEIIYNNPLTLQSSVADISISRLTVGVEGARVVGDVRFKGGLAFLPLLDISESSTLLPNSFNLDIPIVGRTIDIWTEKNVQLILDDGVINLSYNYGDQTPTIDASSLRAQLNFGELIKNSKRGTTAVADVLLDLNEAGESILSFRDTAKAYFLNSNFAIEGINAVLDLQNRSITIRSSINLDDYSDPMLQALSGSLLEATISQDGFDATLSMDGGLEPITILDRGGVGRDVRLSILGTPSMSLAINGDDLNFGFGELNAQIDFGDVLQTTHVQGAVNSVRATIQSGANDANEYVLDFMDDAKSYILGTKLALDGVSARFNANERSLHVEARADLSGYDDLVLQSINEALFVADISREGLSARLNPSGDMQPITILDRGASSKDVRLEFTSAPNIELSIVGNDIDFGLSGGSAKLYFGDLLQGSIANLEMSVDRVYRWSIDGRKKLIAGEKIYLDRLEGTLDLRDLNNPIITFDSNVDMSGYGGLLASVNGASLRDATITKEGFSGSLGVDMGSVDIWREKGVRLVFTDNPTVNFVLEGSGLDIGFANIHADLYFGSLLDDAIARIGNISPRAGKPRRRGFSRAMTQSVENFNWYINGARNLAGSHIDLSGLSGSLDLSDFTNPSITLNARADLSRYGDMFSHIRSAGLENARISKSGFNGTIIAQLIDIDIWKDKNVKVIFDRNRPVNLNLTVNADGVKVGLGTIHASLELGELLEGGVARLNTLREGVFSWSLGERYNLISTNVFLESLLGSVDLEDLQNPIINLTTTVDLSRYSQLFRNLRALELEGGIISKDGFSGNISASLGDIDIWKTKNVKVSFQEDPTMKLEMSRDDFNIGFSNINANLDFGDLLEGEILRLTQLESARDSFASIRNSVRGIRGIKPPPKPGVPVVACRYSWGLQHPHELIEDENGRVTVTQIGGSMDLCDLSDPIIIFDASADFTNYHFEAGNLGVAAVEDASISKRGIDWNRLSISGASTDATILDLGEEEDDVRVEFFNVAAQVESDGAAQADHTDGTLYFGALFDRPYTASLMFNRESNDLKIYTFRMNEDIVYRKNDDSVILRDVHGELEEIRRGVYRVTLNTSAQLQSELFTSLGIQEIKANNFVISEQGFVGDITVNGGLRNSILNGNATVIFNSLGVHLEATRANRVFALRTFDGSLDLSAIFDGQTIADLNYENERVTWNLNSDARIGKFLFKNLGGELDITRAIDSLNFSGRFGYDGIDSLDLELNNFSINRNGVSGTVVLGRNASIAIPGIDGLNLTGFSTTFGQNISGSASLSYDNDAFLGSNTPLHVALEAVVDSTGIRNFTIDSNRLEDINIAGFANMSFTGVTTTPTFSNFSLTLDGAVTPVNDYFSSNNSLEFEGLKISRTGISVNDAGIYKDVSGSGSNLGGLPLNIEQVGIGFSGNRFYVGVRGGLNLELAEAAAGLKLYSDGDLAVDRVSILVNHPAVTFGGELTWYKNDAVYGNSFSATGLQLSLANMFSLKGEFRIGNKERKGFFWMAKAQGGIAGASIPLGPLNIYEIGGGAAFNMSIEGENFVPSGDNNLVIIFSSLIGTPDLGFTWHGQLELDIDTSGQIVLEGDTYILSSKESTDADKKISGRITIGMSPSTIHIRGTATLKYMGIGVNGSTDVLFNQNEKHVYIGSDPRVSDIGLGHVEVDIFGFKPFGYFMLDTSRLAFGAGFDFDKKIGGRCPWARLEVMQRADAYLQYDPFYMDLSAEASIDLDVGCLSADVGIGVDLYLNLRMPNPTYLKAKVCADFPVFGEGCVSHKFGESGGNGPAPEIKLISRIEPIEYANTDISLMPKLKIVTPFDQTRELRISFVSLVDINTNRDISLLKRQLSDTESQYIPTEPLTPNHNYKFSGKSTFYDSYDDPIEQNFQKEFTTTEENKLAFQDIVDHIRPENLASNVNEGQNIIIYYDEIVRFMREEGHELIENYKVEVQNAKGELIEGEFVYRPSGLEHSTVFNPTNDLRIYHFCVDNSTGEKRETFKNNEGEYLNPFLNFYVDGEAKPVDKEDSPGLGGFSPNVPNNISIGALPNANLGNFIQSSEDGSYSYYTSDTYNIIVTDLSNNQIVSLTTFTIANNDSATSDLRRWESLSDRIEPSMTYYPSKNYLESENPEPGCMGSNIETDLDKGFAGIGMSSHGHGIAAYATAEFIVKDGNGEISIVEENIYNDGNVRIPNKNICGIQSASISYVKRSDTLLVKEVEIYEGEPRYEDYTSEAAERVNAAGLQENRFSTGPDINPGNFGAPGVGGDIRRDAAVGVGNSMRLGVGR